MCVCVCEASVCVCVRGTKVRSPAREVRGVCVCEARVCVQVQRPPPPNTVLDKWQGVCVCVFSIRKLCECYCNAATVTRVSGSCVSQDVHLIT